MNKKILGLDLGSNSLGWALLEERDGQLQRVVDLGSRIFSKAVKEKVPTPKNVKRRDMRLGRRVLQRRASRKRRMLNYLVSLNLLPRELQAHKQPEIILNEIGDPYTLRAKALDQELSHYEFGRVLLHFVARRGFLSSKKQVAGDLIDDPDTMAYIEAMDTQPSKDKEEGAFKADISAVKTSIKESRSRTLGEYLFKLEKGQCKRNRSHNGGHLRTDRAMYKEELRLIWDRQASHFPDLPDDFMNENEGVLRIIFYQRPLKLKKDRVGKCSLETKNYRAATARLEVQKFRYLQDINNLKYFEGEIEQWVGVLDDDKATLRDYFEQNAKINLTTLKKLLRLDKKTKFNLEMKNIRGNVTACDIRDEIGERWDHFTDEEQLALVEDLLSIKKKSALKARLITHWDFDKKQAVKLCLAEFEPGHSNHSLKAIKRLLPYLLEGNIYSEAREKAGYGYSPIEAASFDKLERAPETSNPIVNKGLNELRRVINALVRQYGKPDAIRIEMARDLEMNTKRYKENEARQRKNQKKNEDAVKAFQELNLGKYPSYDDRIKYRLWKEQDSRCAYSNKLIALNSIFTSDVEIDHILPYKKSLDDSYMNKVLCYTSENRNKGDRTPKDAWGGNEEKWHQIVQSIGHWKGLDGKVKRFFQTERDLRDRDFISSQLNDTRYISKLAMDYVKQLGCDVSTSKGATTAWLRHQWGLNSLIGETNKKERTDHRHHAIDAAVVACVDRSLYQKIQIWTQSNERKLLVPPPKADFRDELKEHLSHLVVSHATQKKLSGGLHEETGAGYIEKHGGLVYRKLINNKFSVKNANDIVDPTVKAIVLEHLGLYNNDPKKAFADDQIVYHLDGKTPINRVRVLQSKTTLKQLKQNKFGIKNESGEIFKWLAYGNNHHVEIFQNIETGKYASVFVNMMHASHRARGIASHLNPTGKKQPIVNSETDDSHKFIMALHINDMVSLELDEERIFYRVQVLDSVGRLMLRIHTASGVKNSNECMLKSISSLMTMGMRKHTFNAIGVPL